MKKSVILSALVIGILSGCSTIHFDKGEQTSSQNITQSWHHNFVLALYEGSTAVDLSKECSPTSWKSVKTELTFINGLAGGVSSAIIPFLWYPKTVEVSCE